MSHVYGELNCELNSHL